MGTLTLGRTGPSGQTIAEHEGLVASYFQTDNVFSSPYLNSQASKQTLKFICRTCYEKVAFRLDNLVGPSRSEKALKCSHNSSHEMLSRETALFPYHDQKTHARCSKSNWNVSFINAFLQSPQWKKLQRRIPVLQNVVIVVDSKSHSGLEFSAIGDWDFTLSFPSIRKHLLGDIDTLTYHVGKEKRDFNKSMKNASLPNAYTIRIRQEGLGSAFTSGITKNGFEVLDGFNENGAKKRGEDIDFDFAISTLISYIEFIVLKYLMDISIVINNPKKLTNFLNSVAHIHGDSFAKNVKCFVNAYNDYTQSPETFVFGKKHKSFYKAFFDNSLSDNWTAKRAVSPVRRLLGEYLRTQFK